MTPQTVKIQYMGKGSKKVELPIPFIQKCEKTGEVICDPIGEFPYEDGMRLLEIAGKDGLFKLVGEISPDSPAEAKSHDVSRETSAPKIEYYDKNCACGCGGKIQKRRSHAYTGIPRYIMGHSMRKKVEPPSPLASI